MQETKNPKEFSTFEELMLDFLKKVGKPDFPYALVCAIAGGAHGEEINVTNLPHWPTIIISNVQKTLAIPCVRFINDLVAAA